MAERKSIVLTGGGTAGHVIPHEALLPKLKTAQWDIHYIGSSGMEEDLVHQMGLPFYRISSGKLRRYLSWKNVTDLFRIVFGFFQALIILLKLRPKVIFSKGGYVSVPVVMAGWCLRIPVLAHESDLSLGLANKLALPFVRTLFHAFPEIPKGVPKEKALYTGQPVRGYLLEGSRQKGFELLGWKSQDSRPVLLIMGGSQGAQKINDVVFAALNDMIKYFRVIHLTGKGKLGPKAIDESYWPIEYADSHLLPHVMAISDMVLGRAGAGGIFEWRQASLPMLLIPLEEGSRGDQVHNAQVFVKQGWALSLSEKELTKEKFLHALHLFQERYRDMAIHIKKDTNFPQTLALIDQEIQKYG